MADPKESGISYGPTYQTDKESIRGAGDYTIEYVKLYPWNGAEPLDLTNVRETINIFEDIFNNFITGNISLIDSYDLPSLYPIIGEEKLEISFKRPGTKIQGQPAVQLPYQVLEETPSFKMSFRVIKMTERKLVRDKAQRYVLHFVSKEFITNKKVKVQKTFKKTLYSEMVQKIYDKFLDSDKKLTIETTQFEQDFTISNWTPAQVINIIASRSIPKSRKGSSYVFFETIKGFNFVSLEKLFEAESKETLLYQVHNVFLNPLNKSIQEDVRNVNDYDFVEYFDVISNMQNGMYASKLMTYDIVRQRTFEYNYDYMKEFDNVKHLEKNKLCTDKLDALGDPYVARFDLMSTNKDHDKLKWIAGKEPGIMPIMIENYLLQRQSQLQQINNVRMAITLPGNPDRRPGDVISFALPNAMGWPEKYGDEAEKYLSGKYLISAIRHRIEMTGYHQDIEIIKDSYLSKIEYVDPNEIYKPTW